MRNRLHVAFCVLLCLPLASATASTLWVGSNATSPIQLYDDAGAWLGTFGPDGATGVAVSGQYAYIAQPDESASELGKYDAAQTMVGSSSFVNGSDNGLGFPGFILDMAVGAGSTLWLAGYNGMIYHVDPAGSVLSSFDSGHSFTGVATDGSFLYTSEGLFGGSLFKWDMSGMLVETIYTGLMESGGVAFDSASGTLWVGGTDTLTQLTPSGSIVQTLSIPGGFHDGLDVGDVSTTVIPEPSTWMLLGCGLVALGFRRRLNRSSAAVVLAVACASIAQAVPSIQQLTPAPAQPRPVGTAITWTAAATDSSAGALVYQFAVRPPGGQFTVFRDYSSKNTFEWIPADREGIFDVRLTVLNRTTKATAQMSASYSISSRVTGPNAVISATSHPLVALYSAPACPAGSSMRVRFRRSGATTWQSTLFKSCVAGISRNFYVAGMYASTNYSMYHEVITGPMIRPGPTMSFTTGPLGITPPTMTVLNPADPPHSLDFPLVLHTFGGQTVTDLQGRVVWYHNRTPHSTWRQIRGGTFLGGPSRDILTEIDLGGGTVMETNVDAVNDRLAALGHPANQAINSFHHDAIRLPNGYTASLARVERILSDVQGPGPVVIVGDAVVVQDRNMDVTWFWDSFEHLDVTKKAILDEKCGGGGCFSLLSPTDANDWTHSNSISYTPDGHFLISVRHMDWVIKINYANGAGNGNVIWRLGKDGDFTINSSDPYPWFSHSHDAEYELGGTQILSLFDNGNTHRTVNPSANSRGQAFRLDEASHTATFVLNADLGSYSNRIGSAQRLPNGSYHFDSGAIEPNGAPTVAQSVEVNAAGSITFNLQAGTQTYRTFRIRDLYTPF